MKTDLEIQQNILEELQWRPTLKTAKLEVTVNKGVATLSGTVDSHGQKREAENAALSIDGVQAVAEDIRVRLQPGSQRTDTEIAAAALTILRWNTIVPIEKIRLRVEDGWITTEGVVDWMYEQQAVKNSLSHLAGIKGITNLVTVNPKIDIAGLKERIKEALERHANVDASKIHVENNGHKVTLTGTVSSYAERLDAEQVARNAPGAGQVINELNVKIPSYKVL
jgi:osmotically-inducible protein OsmY